MQFNLAVRIRIAGNRGVLAAVGDRVDGRPLQGRMRGSDAKLDALHRGVGGCRKVGAFGKPITLKGLIGPVQQGDVVDRLRRVRDPVECGAVVVVGAGGAGLRHDALQLGPGVHSDEVGVERLPAGRDVPARNRPVGAPTRR